MPDSQTKPDFLINDPVVEPIQGFLAQRPDVGIYIPPYQRPFSWGKKQFERFLAEAANDICSEAQEAHYGIFLGFIICYDDDNNKHVSPPSPIAQLPNNVYNIVDGQQRIIFITLLSVLLHHMLGDDRYKNVLQNSEWFRDKSKDLKKKLERVITVDAPAWKGRPRVIRAREDCWSGSNTTEVFSSSIACFLSHYLKEEKLEGMEDPDSKHSKFTKMVSQLSTLLKVFCVRQEQANQAGDKKNKLANVEELIDNPSLMKAVFSSDDDIRQDYRKAKFNFAGIDAPVKKDLFRILLLGNYIYERVHAIIVVTKTSYDRTLLIFDELNSTGIPLNAFDTFKAAAIRLDVYKYPDSDLEKYINNISEDFATKDSWEEVDDHVAELIVSFALANCGTKLGKAVFKQREHLRLAFNRDVLDEKQYLNRLRFFSTVNDMKRIFDSKNSSGLEAFLLKNLPHKTYNELQEEIDEASFCIGFLSKPRFSITIAPLAVYLHQIHTSNDKKGAAVQFCDAARKIAAFFAIWRSSFQTTHSIESKVRAIMSGDALDEKGEKVKALACCHSSKPLTTDKLASVFRGLLKAEEVQDSNSWISKVGNINAYGIKEVARFILIVGSNKTKVVRKKKSGLEIISDHSVAPLITRYGFDNSLVKTVEHIIPVNEGMAKAKYSKEDKNKLWNLTLVPDDVNKILGNKDWPRKQAIYKCFSAENNQDWKDKLAEAEKLLSKRQLNKLVKMQEELDKQGRSHHGYLPMTNYLAMLKVKDFLRKHGNARNEQILHNCWKKLAEGWLDWESADKE